MSDTKSTIKSTYTPDKTVFYLKPVVTRKSYMGVDNHDGLRLYTGCSEAWQIPITQHNRFVDIFESEEQRAYLEEKLNLKLDTYDRKNEFFCSHWVKIKKSTDDMDSLFRRFDCTNPMDLLELLILRSCDEVANSLHDKNLDPKYTWVLIEEGDEEKEKVSSTDLKAELYTWLHEAKNNKDKLYGALLMYGERVDEKQTAATLYAKMGEIIESGNKASLVKFLDLINDKNFKTKVTISSAVKHRLLLKSGQQYKLEDGEIIGIGLDEVVKWVNDPTNTVLYDNLVKSLKEKIQ